MQKILLLTIGMFALGLDAYVVAGLLPAIGATFHASLSETGQTVSVFTLCYAIAAPLFATLLAGKSVRRILMIALSVFSVANVMSALAVSLSSLLFARAMAGIGAGLYAPVAAAAATTLVSPQKRGRALGMILGGMSIGVVMGVPIGLFIANHIGWQGTLWMVTAIGVIAWLGIFLRFPNLPVVSPPTFSERAAMLTDSRVAVTVGITFLTSIASLGLYTYIAPILHNLAGTDTLTPYLWVWGIGGMMGSFSIGALIDHTRRPGRLMLGILAIIAIALLVLPLGLQFPLAGFFLFALWGAAGWASQAPQQHTLLALQPSHGAAVVALNSSANYLGSSVGAGLGGLVMWAGLSPAQLPFAAGFVAVLALVGQCCILLREIDPTLFRLIGTWTSPQD